MTLYDVLMEQALMYGAGMAMELKKKVKKKTHRNDIRQKQLPVGNKSIGKNFKFNWFLD